MSQLAANKNMQECIRLCKDCSATCESIAQYCLSLGGQFADPALQRSLNDCTQICQTAADFMLRTSPWHKDLCRTCAQVCNECADTCERLGANDVQLKTCADLCRECALSCQQMAEGWQPGMQQNINQPYQNPRH